MTGASELTGGAEPFAGRFQIGRRLRATPLAVVFEAWDLEHGRTVQLTVSRSEPLRKLQRESAWLMAASFRSAATLPQAPGLPRLLEAGRATDAGAGVVWMAAALPTGLTVDQYRRPAGSSEDEWKLLILRVAEQLASALQAVHRAGIVHAALGPSSVLIGGSAPDDVTVAVVDLGPDPGLLRAAEAPLSPQLWSRWAAASIYAAPEVEAGAEPTARSDVYGFGCTLTALLSTVELPERGWDELLHPSDLVDVGLELQRVADQARHEHPAERQYTAQVLVEQLAAIRVAAEADQRQPGLGALELTASLESELPPEFVSAAAWLAARVPRWTLAWIPGWRTLAARTGIRDRAHRPGTSAAAAGRTQVAPFARAARQPGIAAYWAQRSRRAQRRATLILAAALVLVVGIGAVSLRHPFATRPAQAATTAAEIPSSSPSPSSPATGTPPAHPVSVPAVVGTSLEVAEAALQTAGLQAGAVGKKDAAAKAGTVLASSPAGGTAIAPGSHVDLTVASGNTSVPANLVGHGLQAVASELAAAGLAVTTATVNTSGYVTGYVLNVTPAPGSVIQVGSPVTITVAKYVTRTPSPAPTSTSTPAPAQTPTPGASAPPSSTPTAMPSPTTPPRESIWPFG